MAQQTINIGTAANDGTGDPVRTAYSKANSNFTELYARPTGGGGSGTINSGTLNQLGYYAAAGTTLSGLTLGTNLSITSGTLNASGAGGGTDASTLTAANSGGGTVNALTFNSGIETAVYDVTLTAAWAPTLAGVVASKYRRILLYIRGGAGGFTFTMPTATPGAGTIIWSGGAGAPTINTAAGAINRVWFETTDGGTTVLAGY